MNWIVCKVALFPFIRFTFRLNSLTNTETFGQIIIKQIIKHTTVFWCCFCCIWVNINGFLGRNRFNFDHFDGVQFVISGSHFQETNFSLELKHQFVRTTSTNFMFRFITVDETKHKVFIEQLHFYNFDHFPIEFNENIFFIFTIQ